MTSVVIENGQNTSAKVPEDVFEQVSIVVDSNKLVGEIVRSPTAREKREKKTLSLVSVSWWW